MERYFFIPLLFLTFLLLPIRLHATDFSQRYTVNSPIVSQPSYFDIRQERKKHTRPFNPHHSKKIVQNPQVETKIISNKREVIIKDREQRQQRRIDRKNQLKQKIYEQKAHRQKKREHLKQQRKDALLLIHTQKLEKKNMIQQKKLDIQRKKQEQRQKIRAQNAHKQERKKRLKQEKINEQHKRKQAIADRRALQKQKEMQEKILKVEQRSKALHLKKTQQAEKKYIRLKKQKENHRKPKPLTHRPEKKKKRRKIQRKNPAIRYPAKTIPITALEFETSTETEMIDHTPPQASCWVAAKGHETAESTPHYGHTVAADDDVIITDPVDHPIAKKTPWYDSFWLWGRSFLDFLGF